MAKTKKESKAAKLFWRIVISAVGVALIAMALANIALFFVGEKAVAQVSVRRVGGADDRFPANKRYEWAVSYTFKAADGETYNGYTNRRGGDLPVRVENTVYYLPSFPAIHALSIEAQPNLGQLISVLLGVLLLSVMNRKQKKRPPRHRAVRRPDGQIDVPDLEDYDDSVEELFHEEN